MAIVSLRLPAVLILAASALVGSAPVRSEPQRSAVSVGRLPADYRDWRLVSVAREAGGLDDIRAVLGNDVAMKAFRNGTRPFPDGTQIARLAYQYIPSAQNNAVFGQEQSFVAGDPTNVQIMVKDSKRFPETGGWGFGQYQAGEPDPGQAPMQTCFVCHAQLGAAKDYVFTRYAP